MHFSALEQRAGITPAWAGKSLWDNKIIPVIPDYPRVGGEEVSS